MRFAAAILVGAASVFAVVATAGAYEPVGSDFRISNLGSDGDDLRDAFGSAMAYNPTANEYLVTWQGAGLSAHGEDEIFGQRVSATGTELGADFRISNVGMDNDADRDAAEPAVAYNSTANEYLVTWHADALLLTDNELEIYGQRVSAAGAELGSDFRISHAGTDGDLGRQARGAAVAYNQTANEYLVTWNGDGISAPGELEIYGQRVSATGAELGTDFRISNADDAGITRSASRSAVAYNQTANEYLVTWHGDGLATNDEFETFGQRLSAAGAELGTDFRISNMGTDGVAARAGFVPAVAYNQSANEYLVTWYGDGLATDDENEIFGQRVSAAGAELGTDFRISNMGTDGVAARAGFGSAVAYSQTANEYLVTWFGDGLATDDENEIFGQRVSAAGAELGTDFRISNMGTDGDAARTGALPAVAYSQTADEYLVTWQGDGLATDEKFEIFGQRVALAEPPAQPPAGADTDAPDTTITAGPKKKSKKKAATFAFTSTEPASTFECRLDNGGFEPCTSLRDIKVKKGKHSFEVRASDAAGNTDATAATHTWKVKKKKKRT